MANDIRLCPGSGIATLQTLFAAFAEGYENVGASLMNGEIDE